MLYIHIGRGKAGSSTIQHFAAQHRELLQEHGLCYPTLGDGPSHHIELARELYTRADGAGPFAAALRQILDRSDRPKILLSSEWLFGESAEVPARLSRLIGRQRPVRIIFYIRDYPGWACSYYAQQTRRGTNWRDFDAFLRADSFKTSMSIRNQLSRWIEEFGPEAVRVRTLDRHCLAGGNLLRDFLSAVDLDPAVLCNIVASNFRANPSPAWTFLELVRAIFRIAASQPGQMTSGPQPKDIVNRMRQFQRLCEAAVQKAGLTRCRRGCGRKSG